MFISNDRASDHDVMFYEHMRYCGKLLLKQVHHLFNLYIKFVYIPKEKSMMIILNKDGNSYKRNKNPQFKVLYYHFNQLDHDKNTHHREKLSPHQ